ncbi:hypothetical protein [Sphingomonas sanxanigenens]|uniref:Uncharacterized protein n=1 Tax=Sphingomonas sanxanigenens DSM 19645 = NX02 TaxID=1123269 RepID=W0AJI8_9SPHN|nr:hypothetical protein [Sphingomonas sanxanigenens]AHE56458.1 hypothetical protein NX02_24255 [Sphingomonas sanxanigenens DSM 19645 = NX02]
MRAIPTLTLIAGIFALVVGLLWVGQGTGLVRWPASSFMIDQSRWTYNGAVLVVVGLVAILFARRR